MLPEGFIADFTQTVGPEAAGRFAEAMGQAPSVSVRLNPFKTPAAPDPLLDGAPRPF